MGVRWARIVPLAMTLVIAQVGVFPQLRLFGAVPDLALLLALGMAWTHGPEVGAWFGFVGGLAIDFVVATPLGATALAYAVVAFAVGAMHHAADRHAPAISAFLGLAGGLAAGCVFVVVAIAGGADHLRSAHSIKLVLATALYDAFLAIPTIALADRMLDDRRYRRI